MSEVYVHNLIAQYKWQKMGNISVAGSALTTDKSAATVHALTATTFVRIQVDDGAVALNLRWRGGTNDVDNVQVLYAKRPGDDHYTRIVVLTLTPGTQTDGTYLFVDTIAKANEKWTDTIVAVSDEADGIAHLVLNCHGYSDFVLLGTTVNSTLYVDAARE